MEEPNHKRQKTTHPPEKGKQECKERPYATVGQKSAHDTLKNLVRYLPQDKKMDSTTIYFFKSIIERQLRSSTTLEKLITTICGKLGKRTSPSSFERTQPTMKCWLKIIRFLLWFATRGTSMEHQFIEPDGVFDLLFDVVHRSNVQGCYPTQITPFNSKMVKRMLPDDLTKCCSLLLDYISSSAMFWVKNEASKMTSVFCTPCEWWGYHRTLVLHLGDVGAEHVIAYLDSYLGLSRAIIGQLLAAY